MNEQRLPCTAFLIHIMFLLFGFHHETIYKHTAETRRLTQQQAKALTVVRSSSAKSWLYVMHPSCCNNQSEHTKHTTQT